jgi:hypothetical protein
VTKAWPLISSFNAGELSPLLSGRPDTAKYQEGLSLCQNFIPRVQGAVVRRGGTRFVSEVKDSTKRVWLVRFEYSVDDAFVLEFGDGYIRFYRGRGVFIDGGVPYEIASPYSAADLTATDGSFALRYVQSGDVMYLAHAAHQPRKLVRVANNNWTLGLLQPTGGPFKDQNIDQTVTVYASAATGAGVTLMAPSAVWQAGHVGSIFQIEMQDGASIKPWFPGRLVTGTGDITYSDGKYYSCSAVPTSTIGWRAGSVTPIHTHGKFWDGDGVSPGSGSAPNGVEWQYLHPGFGWVLITGFTDATHVTATVLSTLPDQVVGSGNPTFRWSYGAWSDVEGWPSTVTFFRERLTFGAGQRLYFSVSGDYENSQPDEFGTVTNDSAMNILIQSKQGGVVQWLAPVDTLLVGTQGTVFAVGEITTTSAFGPTNIAEKDQVLPGSTGVTPVIADAVVYVEKAGRFVNECTFGGKTYFSALGSYSSTDLTIFAEHMTLSGIVDMAYAKQPHNVIWQVRADGLLVGFTYKKEQNVSGWHRHPIGGGGLVESVTSIPSPDASRDDLWMVVRRTINGVTRRYVEYLSPEYLDGDDPALSCYSDSAAVYNGASTSTLSGLGYLEGATVNVKANGAYHRALTVTGGSITLDYPATKATVGLAAKARAMLWPLEAGAEGGGTAQGRPKRINRVIARLYNSLGGRWGPDFDENLPPGQTMERPESRTALDDMDAPPPILADVDQTVEFPGDYDGRAAIAWECDQDFPFTLVSVMPEVTTYGYSD